MDNIKFSVGAVVVTYNRENDLINCLEALVNQSTKPDSIYIIDNHSNFQTPELLFKHKYITHLPLINNEMDQLIENDYKEISIKYYRKQVNDGGAGGFYFGMKVAYENGSDWIWLMDDDGIPELNQLKNLLQGATDNNIDYSNALVLSNVDKEKLSFKLGKYESYNQIKDLKIISNLVSPFNGTLIKRQVIDKIGFIKKEMFIWGDETEYTNRVKKYGFSIATIIDAIHYHPMMRGSKTNVFSFTDKFKVIEKPKHFSKYYYRNLGFNTKQYSNYKSVIALFILYNLFFLLKIDFIELMKFNKYYFKGIINNYN